MKLKIYFLLFLAMYNVSSFAIFDKQNQLCRTVKKIGGKLSELIQVDLPFGVQRMVVYTLSDKTEVQDISNDIIRGILSDDLGNIRSVYVAAKSLQLESIKKPCRSRFNVIITDNLRLEFFFKTIEGQSPMRIFSSKAITVFIVVESKPVNSNQLNEIFHKILSFNVLNSFIIHINLGKDQFTVRSFNFFPFATVSQRSKILEFSILDIEFNTSHIDKDSNLNGHRLKLVQYDDPPKSFTTLLDPLRGYDGMLMRVVCEKLNATPKVIRLPCTDRFTVSSAIKLHNGTADISVNSQMFLSRDYSNSTFDFIYPQILESLNLLVPTQVASSWGYLSVFRPFRYEIWFVLLLTMVSFTFMWYFIRVKVLKLQSNFSDLILTVWRIHVCNLVTQPVRTTSERFLFTGYMLFAFVIMNGYQTILISILSSPDSPPIFSLSDVNASNKFDIIIPAKYEMSEHLTSDHLRGVMRNNYKVTNVNIWDFGGMERNESHTYMVPSVDGTWFRQSVSNRRQDGDLMYNLVEEGVLYSVNTHMTRKSFILEKRISYIVERIRQAKLLDKFVPQSLFEARQHGLLSKEQQAATEQNRRVTMESLKSAFALLILGYAISIAVFVFELRHPLGF